MLCRFGFFHRLKVSSAGDNGHCKQRTPCGGKLSGARPAACLAACASRFPLALFWRSILFTLVSCPPCRLCSPANKRGPRPRLKHRPVDRIASVQQTTAAALDASSLLPTLPSSSLMVMPPHPHNPSAAARVSPLWTYLLVSTSTLTLQPGLLPTWLDGPDWIHSPHSVSWILLPLVASFGPSTACDAHRSRRFLGPLPTITTSCMQSSSRLQESRNGWRGLVRTSRR